MTDWSQENAYAPFEAYEESQLGEGGPNAVNNCIPDAYSAAVQVLGGPHLEAPDIVSREYGPGFVGYTSYSAIEQEVAQLWPGGPWPSWRDNPTDTIASVDLAGVKNFPILCLFHCDRQANLVTAPTGFIHCCPIMAHRGGRLIMLNVWGNKAVGLTEADFRLATSGTTAGLLAVLQRAIPAQPQPQPQPQPSGGGEQ